MAWKLLAWALLSCSAAPTDSGANSLVLLADTAITLVPCGADQRAFLEDIITAGLRFSDDRSCPGGVKYELHDGMALHGSLQRSEDGFVSLDGADAYSPAPVWQGGGDDGVERIFIVHRQALGQTYGQLWLSASVATEGSSCRMLAIGPGTD